ncbi:ferric-chelate reductase [Microbotryomycetes sp. JL201]|nr:ferric-chelate reductase [Microbotryomycetes sp. JL201]
MKALTVEDVQALSSLYDVHKDIVTRADRYGTYMRQIHLQSYVTRRFNAFYVPNLFNIILWACVGFLIFAACGLRLARAVGGPHLTQFRRARTALVKHLWLSSATGQNASAPVLVFGSRWLSLQIPLRIHSLIVFAYIAANLVVVFAFYTTYTPNIFWPELGYPFAQHLRYFADRTGILALGATPLAILLAGRNSPLGILTGASFSTLQIYHRWVARTIYFHGVAHGVAFSVVEWLSSTKKNNYIESFEDAYWNWGVAALVGGGLLAFASLRRIREIAYEFFLISHIVGAIVWVVGCYYHVYLLRNDWYLLKFIYATIAVWGFDRLCRLARIAYLNLSFTRKSRQVQSAEALVLPGKAYTRVRIKMARPWPRNLDLPGSYVFLSSPSVKAWQSHPFSIALPTDMPAQSSGSICSTPSTSNQDKVSYSEDQHVSSELEDARRTFEVVVKTHSGFTRDLVEFHDRSGNKNDVESAETSVTAVYRPVRVWVDGPYGPTNDLSSFEHIVLFAGGSGITVSISHLARLAKQACTGDLFTRKVDLIWAIPDTGEFAERPLHELKIGQRLIQVMPDHTEPLCLLESMLARLVLFLPSGCLTVNVHVTARDCASKFADNLSTQFPVLHSVIARSSEKQSSSIKTGRPIASVYLDEALSSVDGANNLTKVAVSACGPPTLLDDARLAVKHRLDGVAWTCDSLVYHDELFTW